MLLIYLDDAILPATWAKKYFKDLGKATIDKSHLNAFFFNGNCFLKHRINAVGIEANPNLTRAVKNWPQPRAKYSAMLRGSIK